MVERGRWKWACRVYEWALGLKCGGIACINTNNDLVVGADIKSPQDRLFALHVRHMDG